jgi:hypothetical protein
MKQRKEQKLYSRGATSGSVEPIKSHQALKTGYSIENTEVLPALKEKVDKEEQAKFKSAMGDAFKKLKEKKLQEAEEKIKKEKGLKKMPKMIIPDLGPDFRHEVKLDASEEAQMEKLRKMARKYGGA